MIIAGFYLLLKHWQEKPEKLWPEWGFEPDLCHGAAVPYQLSY